MTDLYEAITDYMSQFGQALEAHDIPFGEAQSQADQTLRAVLPKLHSLLTEPNRQDIEDCGACSEDGDICLYHQGIEDGVNFVQTALDLIFSDPDEMQSLYTKAVILKARR